jgi:hypothetical protein
MSSSAFTLAAFSRPFRFVFMGACFRARSLFRPFMNHDFFKLLGLLSPSRFLRLVFFILCVAHALPAMEFAARPSARNIAFNEHGQLREGDYKSVSLRNYPDTVVLESLKRANQKGLVRNGSLTARLSILGMLSPQEKVSWLDFGKQHHERVAMLARAQRDRGISTHGAIHESGDWVHRAPGDAQRIRDRVTSVNEITGNRFGTAPVSTVGEGIGKSASLGERRPMRIKKHQPARQMKNQPISLIARNSETTTDVTSAMNRPAHATGIESGFHPFHTASMCDEGALRNPRQYQDRENL